MAQEAVWGAQDEGVMPAPEENEEHNLLKYEVLCVYGQRNYTTLVEVSPGLGVSPSPKAWVCHLQNQHDCWIDCCRHV